MEGAYMNEQLEQRMREIIWRRWTTGEYPTLDDLHPNIYTREVYDELVESGVEVPKGAMEQILKDWMALGYIRARSVGGSSEDKRWHGSMKLVEVYESLIRSH
jgi:hypothetical protein